MFLLQKRKLSHPEVVASTLHYIPFLEKQISFLSRRREELKSLIKISQISSVFDQTPCLSSVEESPAWMRPRVNIYPTGKETMVNVGVSSTARKSVFRLVMLLEERNMDVLSASMLVCENVAWITLHINNSGQRFGVAGDLQCKIIRLLREELVAAEAEYEGREFQKCRDM